MRFDRMSGLDSAQLDGLEQMVSELLEEPWDKGEGRPRKLTLREALIVTCGYLRQNIIEDVWAEIFGVAQSTISRYITFLTPFVENVTAEDRPTAEDAAEATRGAIALVDGTLWPCWSWDGERTVVWEIQDHGTRLTDRHESSGTYNFRFRACYRQQARHGETEGFGRGEDPEESRRRVRRQGIHRG